MYRNLIFAIEKDTSTATATIQKNENVFVEFTEWGYTYVATYVC